MPYSYLLKNKKVTLAAVPQKRVREGAILKLPFGTTNIVAYANKVYVCLFVTKNMGILIAMGLSHCKEMMMWNLEHL